MARYRDPRFIDREPTPRPLTGAFDSVNIAGVQGINNVADPLRTPFAANLTNSPPSPVSWQAKTLAAGVWATDTPTGTADAYPVQINGVDFIAGASGTSTIMWEEPPGSGAYAFLPIQYASATVPGFVNTLAQAFAGVKTFDDDVYFVGQIALGNVGPNYGPIWFGTPANPTFSASIFGSGNVPATEVSLTINSGAFVIIQAVTLRVDALSSIDFYGSIGTSSYPTLRVSDGTTPLTGGTGTVNGMVFQSGLYISGSVPPPPPPPPPPPAVTSVAVASPGGTLSVSGSPITTAGTFDLDTIGDSGNDPDHATFHDGLCIGVSTLSGVNATWTVAVGDVVVITNGRIQSITPV